MRTQKELTTDVEKAIAEIRIKTGKQKPDMILLKETAEKYNLTIDKLMNVGNWDNYDYNGKID